MTKLSIHIGSTVNEVEFLNQIVSEAVFSSDYIFQIKTRLY